MRHTQPALALVALLLLPWNVSAHAVLEWSDPPDNAALAQSPAMITLNFSEPVSPIFARVLDRNGKSVTSPADVSVVDKQLRIRLTPVLPDGQFMLTYRITSADTHTVGGAYPFSVGAIQTAAASSSNGFPVTTATSGDTESEWTRLVIGNRALQLAALLIAAGGSLYLLLLERHDSALRRAMQTLLWPAALAGTATALLAMGLQGGSMADAPLSALLSADIWRLGAESTRGTSSLLTIAGLWLIATGIRGIATRLSDCLLVIGLLCASASLVVAGHAATVEPRWMVLTAWLVHTAVAAFWVGSLPPLLMALARKASGENTPAQIAPIRVVRRFSRIALPGVAALLASGALLAAIQLGPETFAALDASSHYALALLVKLALVATMLTLAALNRYVLVPRLRADSGSNKHSSMASRALRRSIVLELIVGLAVIVAATILSQQRPPASWPHAAPSVRPSNVVSAQPGAHQEIRDSRGNRALLRIEPGPDGRMRLVVRFTDSSSQPITPRDAMVEFSNVGAGIEPLSRRLERPPAASTAGSGAGDEFRYSGNDLTIPGRWSVRIEVLITDFEQAVFQTEIIVQPR